MDSTISKPQRYSIGFRRMSSNDKRIELQTVQQIQWSTRESNGENNINPL